MLDRASNASIIQLIGMFSCLSIFSRRRFVFVALSWLALRLPRSHVALCQLKGKTERGRTDCRVFCDVLHASDTAAWSRAACANR